VLLPDGTHVNHTLVKNGWWWWYRKYAPGDTLLEGLEKAALEAKEGCGPIHSRCRRGGGGGRDIEILSLSGHRLSDLKYHFYIFIAVCHVGSALPRVICGQIEHLVELAC
jgi:hypothetical protein